MRKWGVVAIPLVAAIAWSAGCSNEVLREVPGPTVTVTATVIATKTVTPSPKPVSYRIYAKNVSEMNAAIRVFMQGPDGILTITENNATGRFEKAGDKITVTPPNGPSRVGTRAEMQEFLANPKLIRY